MEKRIHYLLYTLIVLRARNDPSFKANSWGVIPTAVPFSFVLISAQIIFLKNWHIIPSNYPSKDFNKSNKFARKPK